MSIRGKMQKSWSRLEKTVRENKFLMKPFLILFGIYLVGMLAIILASVHYADDIGRTERGYAVWANFSRYINEILSRFVHADNYLTNIAPLPQILAVGVLAVAGMMLLCVIVGKDKFKQPWAKWIGLIIATIPLGLCPYMLECLSYQYDAIYMALSVFFAVFPLLFRKSGGKVYIISIIIGTLGVCMTYQAVIGVYPMLIIFLMMREWSSKEYDGKKERKRYLKNNIVALAVFVVALAVFQKFLMIPQDLYVSNSLPSIQDYIPETLKHLGQYFGLVWSDFKILWLVLIGLILVTFVVSFVDDSRRNKYVAFLVAILGIGAMAVCMFIIYASLAEPLYAPRAMYGVGILIAIIGVYVVDKVRIKIWRVAVWVLGWCFVVFAFTYGNALREQDQYRNNRINMVVSDLNELQIMQSGEPKIIQATGTIGFSPIIEHMPQDYQMLSRLLRSSFNEGLIWETYSLVYLCDIGNLRADLNVDLSSLDLPVIKDTAAYRIRGEDDKILVEFKEGHR